MAQTIFEPSAFSYTAQKAKCNCLRLIQHFCWKNCTIFFIATLYMNHMSYYHIIITMTAISGFCLLSSKCVAGQHIERWGILFEKPHCLDDSTLSLIADMRKVKKFPRARFSNQEISAHKDISKLKQKHQFRVILIS